MNELNEIVDQYRSVKSAFDKAFVASAMSAIATRDKVKLQGLIGIAVVESLPHLPFLSAAFEAFNSDNNLGELHE